MGVTRLDSVFGSARPFFSPKGWDNIAQGNALGFQGISIQPEGLGQGIAEPKGVPALQAGGI